ncbi:hypothetical protein O9G_006072 [Rozella allomycis CSF55]|uniref:26S proteasome non-ATPase regulatory subunit 3 N-terminal TPR repeats domain-containing protein n=1 Tax=Rozella allomycis (strain CSF55) TaxID=988480 RepID=A0A075AMD3_ROZAC|nr:hypothetical protein O9G_006072 [Rozella allomycis CSF55]|eukprot:EPZ30749.1 hypothetical protein O9G_006072 [Rozella allomycis CSF55]
MVSTTASNNIKDQKSTSEMQVDKTPAEVQKTAVAGMDYFRILAAGMVAKGVNNNEKRFITRVVRGVNALKKRLNGEIVCLAMQGLVSKSSGVRKNIEGIFGFKSEEMEVDKNEQSSGVRKSIEGIFGFKSEEMEVDKNEQSIPEVEYYFGLLALVHLIESKRLEDAANFVNMLVGNLQKTDRQSKRLEEAANFVNILVGNLQKTDRRSLDQIAAKIYFYYGRIFELKNSGEEIRG